MGGRLVTRPPAFWLEEPAKCSKPAWRLLGKDLDIMYNPALQDQCEWLVVKPKDRG